MYRNNGFVLCNKNLLDLNSKIWVGHRRKKFLWGRPLLFRSVGIVRSTFVGFQMARKRDKYEQEELVSQRLCGRSMNIFQSLIPVIVSLAGVL